MVEARMLHRSVEFMIKAFLDRAAARIGVFTMV
jgi:hypothetical protein